MITSRLRSQQCNDRKQRWVQFRSVQSPQSSVVVVLDDDEEIIVVGHHHELALLGPHSHERHVVGRVHLLEHRDGLVDEAAEDVAVLGGGGGVQRGLDGDSLLQ